jgi:hypothetical protein
MLDCWGAWYEGAWKEFAPGGGGNENEFGAFIIGRWPGGGGSENEFGVFIPGRWFIDILDIDPPRFAMEDRLGFAAVMLLLLDHGFEAGVPQRIEVEAGVLWKLDIGCGWSGAVL